MPNLEPRISNPESPGAPAEFAWMGWCARFPAEWRPVRFEGNWERGAVFVGDGEQAVLVVRWMRLPAAGAGGSRAWVERRLRQEKVNGALAVLARAPAGFAESAWVPEDRSGDGARAVWLGWDSAARLGLEVIVNGAVPATVRDTVSAFVLPSLRVCRATEPLSVALFGTRCEAPAGFRLEEGKLLLGDIALRFRSADGCRHLRLRQVYPASLALSRRSLDRWLEIWPFPEHRRFQEEDDAVPFEADIGGQRVVGVRRKGWKRLPFPLGRVAPLHSRAAVVRSAAVDRLYFAEHDSRGVMDEAPVLAALQGMGTPGQVATGV